jgi:FKBP-type peptidyl-prolyl cis-trans isomerase
MQLSAAVLTTVLLLQGGGLIIKDIKKGKGPAAKPGDTVSVSYVGKLTNGTVFDSTKKNGGKPYDVTIGVTRVIKGWTKGLVGMRKGGQRRLTIPPDMAYGAKGYPGVIPPNATLIFDVTIVDMKQAHK